MSQSFVPRRACPQDLDQLIQMRRELQAHLESSNPLESRDTGEGESRRRERYLALMAGANSAFVIAQADACAIGMGLGQVIDRESLSPARIGHLGPDWVTPIWRRSGVCRAIVDEIAGFFSNHQVEDVFLDYTVGNANAKATWARFRFQPVMVTARARLCDLLAGSRERSG